MLWTGRNIQQFLRNVMEGQCDPRYLVLCIAPHSGSDKRKYAFLFFWNMIVFAKTGSGRRNKQTHTET
jgi:hypothetical protein